ncbi:MAG: iron ABC transporter permease [Burkholderiales bacterium]|nr:iron ABC transporter permease [Burkholderiales bacterium]
MSLPPAGRSQRALTGWLLLGLGAFTLLPWYLPADAGLWSSVQGAFGGEQTASGLLQAVHHGRPWLWSGLIGLLIGVLAHSLRTERQQGCWLLAGALLGLTGLLVAGFAIGARGWSQAVLAQAFGELPVGQPGIGLGGALVLLALLMQIAAGLARVGRFRGDLFTAGTVVLCGALLLLFVMLPVARALAGAFLDDAGQPSLAALTARLGSERLWGLDCLGGATRCGVAWNTLGLGLLTATGTTVLGALLALAAERGPARLTRPLNLLALLPIITPPFVVGLGLILLFGRAGLVNQGLEWAFGIVPTRWFYGLPGLWLAQLFAFTPIAFLILRGVVQGISPALEEAAQTLRASRWQTFRTVTLPLMKPGLANAFLVGFIESMADFGNPIIVGGQHAVLSTEIFFAIVGAQYDQGRAAALALVLTAFALAAFLAQQRVLGRAAYTTVSGKGDAGIAMALPAGLRRLCLGVALPWLAFTLVVYLFAFAGGFVQTWGRDYTPTLAHLRTAFDLQWGAAGPVWTGTAWQSLFTTVWLAAIAAPLCALMGLLVAWLIARTRFAGRRAFEFGALLTFAIPGTVLGVSYILAFNVPPFELTGTALIIVLCFVFRNLPVGVRAGVASLAQIDRSLDEASALLRAGTATTLRRVLLPLLRPALVTALLYGFVRSMTTVSAVVFLVTAETELATTYIIGRVSSGDYGVALAYCTVLIGLMMLATLAIRALVGERATGRRARAIPAPHPSLSGHRPPQESA